MVFSVPPMPLDDFAREVARLLPEYLPGVSTGTATITEGRGCWIRAWKALLTTLGNERGMQTAFQEEGDCSLAKQLTLYWKQGDGIMAAFLSGWGDREELERRFRVIETIKAPLKAVIYSCTKWQEAVLEQFEGALLRYPHHIEGEQYLMLNLLGSDRALAAHAITIARSGRLVKHDIDLLRPLPGSPYRWGNERHGESSGARFDGAAR